MANPKKGVLTITTCLVIACVTFGCFWQLRGHTFIDIDDSAYIYENPHVYHGLTWDALTWAFQSVYASNWHPLTWVSHMVDCELFGLNPAGHHLANLIFHAINTLLLFLLLKEITGAFWKSAFVAALFAWHPLHVESVAWASERKDVLSTFFWIVTLVVYARYARRPRIWSYLLTLLVFILGLMSKPMVVTLPFVLLLLDFWPLCRVRASESARETNAGTTPRSLAALIIEKVPFLALSLTACVITYLAQHKGGAVTSFKAIPLHLRISNALISYVRYIYKTVLPADLSVIYPYKNWSLIWTLAAALFLFITTILLIWRIRRYPYLATGWFWYVGTLVPTIGLIQVGSQAMADRYMYIPSIGLFILAVWGADAISNSWTHKKVVLGTTAGVALACFLTCTWLQLQYWQNSEKLFRHAIETTKENYVAYNGLGNALHRRGRTDEAIPLFEKSLSIDPHYADALFNLGTAFMAKGNLNEAAKYFAAALSENPNFAHAHVNWGNVLLKQGQLDSAAEHYRKGISLVPDDAEMHYNLGTVLSLQSNRDEAILEFSKTTELEPSYGDAYNNLGIALIQQGKMIEGSTHLVKAVRLDPHNPKFRFNLALALDQQMKSREAISQYRETLNLRPDYPEALEGLAKILACNPDMNLRDGAEAVRLAERACELTNHQQPPMLMTLASAYAEAGRFPDALETAQKARALALTQDRYDWVHTTDKLIEHFKNGRAFGK